MSATIISGVVKNGLVVPDGSLPEGAQVGILLSPPIDLFELQNELADWERFGDEAWNMIDEWEAESKS